MFLGRCGFEIVFPPPAGGGNTISNLAFKDFVMFCSLAAVSQHSQNSGSSSRATATADPMMQFKVTVLTWLEAPPNESAIQSIARNLERRHDHNNLSGSILVLALLRPHLYMDDPVPLRVFGYPAPHELLAMDASPHSGGGPDSKRTNLLEALCAFWLAIDSPASRHCFHAVQDVWHVMRVRAGARTA